MSGLIPQAFLDDLLLRTDLVELIDSYVPLKKAGNSHIACCPFHNEKGPSFNVIAKKQFYHCFGCGESGNAISFVMRYLNQGFTEAVATLAARIGLTVPREGDHKPVAQTQNLYQLLENVSKWYEKTLKQSPEAIAYLKNRGLNGETAALYQLGYVPEGWHHLETAFSQHKKDLITTGMLIQKDDGKTCDRYRQRIMFPIHDRKGRLIGFGGRTLQADQKPKYLNSPETPIFQKNRELYGLHQVLNRFKQNISCILVVEGYMDVIALAQHGIYHAVATLGTATSNWHIQLLQKHTKKIIFCFDGDTAGKQAALRAMESSLPQLHGGLEVSFMFLPDDEDPDSLVRQEGEALFLQRLQTALPLHQFFLDTLTKNINLSTPAGKTQLIEMAKGYFSKMVDSPYKQILVDNISRLTHIESHRLNNLLQPQTAAVISKASTITRTPLRVAMALLLQHPDIYEHCKKTMQPTFLDSNELTVLNKLITHITQFPTATTAHLVECWRETPLFDSINKLASWDHQVPEAQLVEEFEDIMQFLEKQHGEKKIQLLLQKSRQDGLTTEEKMLLQTMLKARHDSKVSG